MKDLTNQIKYPDYYSSILSVVSSILIRYGVRTGHTGHPLTDEALKDEPRNVIMFVFDGMGMNMVDELSPHSFFRTHLKAGISSVFPSTTAASTNTLKTGQSPAEHGRIGMFLYFDEAGDNVSIFTNRRVSDGKVLEGQRLIDRYTPVEKIYSLIEKHSPDVAAFEISEFSEEKAESLEDICNKTLKYSDTDGRHFMLCYWDEPDRTAHIYGANSRQVKEAVKSFSDAVENLSGKLPDDTLVIITSDHGHKDTKWINLEDYPELKGMLKRNPSVERRATAFSVREDFKEEFKDGFIKAFGDKFMLLSCDEVIEKGLLGPGEMNDICRDFIGDYMAVATGDYSIALTDEDFEMKSCHAGMTDSEMTVPLIIFQTPSRLTQERMPRNSRNNDYK